MQMPFSRAHFTCNIQQLVVFQFRSEANKAQGTHKLFKLERERGNAPSLGRRRWALPPSPPRRGETTGGNSRVSRTSELLSVGIIGLRLFLLRLHALLSVLLHFDAVFLIL